MIMKKVLILLLSLFTTFVFAQDTSHDILLKVASEMQSKKSISYAIKYDYRGSGVREDDTMKFIAEVAMLRDSFPAVSPV